MISELKRGGWKPTQEQAPASTQAVAVQEPQETNKEQASYEYWLSEAREITVEKDGHGLPLLPPELQEQVARALASSEPMTYQDWKDLRRHLWDLKVPYIRNKLRLSKVGRPLKELPISEASQPVEAAKTIWDAFTKRGIDCFSHMLATVTPEQMIQEAEKKGYKEYDSPNKNGYAYFIGYSDISEFYDFLTKGSLDVAGGIRFAEVAPLARLIAERCSIPLTKKIIEFGKLPGDLWIREIAHYIFLYVDGNEQYVTGIQDYEEQQTILKSIRDQYVKDTMARILADVNVQDKQPRLT